jgi:hypothetical protein
VELGIFLFSTMFRTALRPTQPPIQCVSGALPLWVRRPGREADHSPPSMAEVKECVELCLHFPIRLHGVVLSLKKAQGQLYFTSATAKSAQCLSPLPSPSLPSLLYFHPSPVQARGHCKVQDGNLLHSTVLLSPCGDRGKE